MIFQDRPYQTEAVASIWNYFRTKSGNPLIGMPTGTGKSIVIARFLQSVYASFPQQRIMILTHVKELIGQNYEKLLRLWPFAPAGIYSAGLNQKNSTSPITFGGIASVAKKWALFGKIDLILIDEAHLLSPNDETMYQRFITNLKSINPNLKVVGFTATPWRLGYGHLTDPAVDKEGNETPALFTDMCFDITGLEPFNRLIAEGYVIPLIPKRTKTELSIEGLHKRGGEYIDKEMQELFDKEEITYAALKEAAELGHDRKKWLVFASGIDHCENVCDMLNQMGIPSASVHSRSPNRDEDIAKFIRGEYRAVVNNNVLTTGFDDPEIDMIIVLRATASTVLWVQMLGRGTRPIYEGLFDLNTIEGRLAAIETSGKVDCLVLDYARNTARLGPVNDPVIPRAKGNGTGDAPVKLCEICDTYNHATVKFCVKCGAEFSFDVKFKPDAASDELIKEDFPVVEVFNIDHITFNTHRKAGKPDSIKVSYYCNLNVFSEFICLEHDNWARRKAVRWWKERSHVDTVPDTTVAGLEEAAHLVAPTQIRVWTNKRYPEIMAFCFDGSSFGTLQAGEFSPIPTVRSHPAPKPPPGSLLGIEDDDIPF